MHKKFHIFFISIFLMYSTTSIFAEKKYSINPDECVDGVCYVPQQDEEGNQVYAVVSPVGYHDVEMIKQAPRLDSFNGKTFALVGGSFMAVTTHSEIKKCLEKEFPDSKIYMFDDVGAAGPFSVFGTTEKTKAFQEELKI